MQRILQAEMLELLFIGLNKLLKFGTTKRGEIQKMDSIRVAMVLDTFGNILGIIEYTS